MYSTRCVSHFILFLLLLLVNSSYIINELITLFMPFALVLLLRQKAWPQSESHPYSHAEVASMSMNVYGGLPGPGRTAAASAYVAMAKYLVILVVILLGCVIDEAWCFALFRLSARSLGIGTFLVFLEFLVVFTDILVVDRARSRHISNFASVATGSRTRHATLCAHRNTCL